MTRTAKIQANRLRRWALRMGWQLERSRTRILSTSDLGRWRLIDSGGTVITGAHYDATLDQIEEALLTEQRRLTNLDEPQ